MESKYKVFIEYLKELKERNDLKIVDTHIHPLDVMGIVHYTETLEEEYPQFVFKLGLLGKMNFNRVSNYISKKAFVHLQSIVKEEIEKTYKKLGSKKIIKEMDEAQIDNIVLLPIEPWATTSEVCERYHDKRFFRLASIDIHGIKKEEIAEKIRMFKREYKIVGLKLHPNLQGFLPQPSQNNKNLAEKLTEIYKVADKENLYLLFHGGLSSYTKYKNAKYPDYPRSLNNAKIKNFINLNGESELFKYKVPIIIAHLGHFGENKIDKAAINLLAKQKNFFFDTAATSPKMIAEMIKLIGSERLLLGSDGVYNRMAHSAYLVYQAAKKTNKDVEKIMCDILGRNYFEKVIKINEKNS